MLVLRQWRIIRTALQNDGFMCIKASQDEIENILSEAKKILKINSKLSEIVYTYISAVSALHDKFLHTKITHNEIEDLFGYVEINPESETVRALFFKILNESEDAGKERDFLTTDIKREAFQDAKYNPMGSGIPAVDFYEELLEYLQTSQPYIRNGKKIKRNDPCPCGSGLKFKKCCQGKGIYD